jgi:hypothetical protein
MVPTPETRGLSTMPPNCTRLPLPPCFLVAAYTSSGRAATDTAWFYWNLTTQWSFPAFLPFEKERMQSARPARLTRALCISSRTLQTTNNDSPRRGMLLHLRTTSPSRCTVRRIGLTVSLDTSRAMMWYRRVVWTGWRLKEISSLDGGVEWWWTILRGVSGLGLRAGSAWCKVNTSLCARQTHIQTISRSPLLMHSSRSPLPMHGSLRRTNSNPNDSTIPFTFAIFASCLGISAWYAAKEPDDRGHFSSFSLVSQMSSRVRRPEVPAFLQSAATCAKAAYQATSRFSQYPQVPVEGRVWECSSAMRSRLGVSHRLQALSGDGTFIPQSCSVRNLSKAFMSKRARPS